MSTTMPTREQLAMAYRHYADHHWPPTLDAALQRPAYSAVLITLARKLGRPAWGAMRQPAHSLPTGPVPATPTAAELAPHLQRPIGSLATGPSRGLAAWPKQQSTAAKPGTHDCKRAAANDKD